MATAPSRAAVARRLLLFAFFFGCAVSAAASGRFTLRLIVDGLLSFAFVPIIELAAFAVVWRTRVRPQRAGASWTSDASEFLAGNDPWLYWLVAAMTVAAVVPPHSLSPWIRPIEASMIVPILWSARIDVRYFQELGRSSRAAIRDAVMFRAIAWTLGITYFLGIAIWSLVGL